MTVWIRRHTSSIFVLKRNPPGAVAAWPPSCSVFTPITAISEREKKKTPKRKAWYWVLWKWEHASWSQHEQLPYLCLRQVILSKTRPLYRSTRRVLGFWESEWQKRNITNGIACFILVLWGSCFPLHGDLLPNFRPRILFSLPLNSGYFIKEHSLQWLKTFLETNGIELGLVLAAPL